VDRRVRRRRETDLEEEGVAPVACSRILPLGSIAVTWMPSNLPLLLLTPLVEM